MFLPYMDYIEVEIDSTLSTQSSTSLSSKDTPLVNIGRTLTNIVGAKILEVNIPFSYYVIASGDGINAEDLGQVGFGQNRLNLFFNGFDSLSITIPVGNYTGPDLAAVIQTLLLAAVTASTSFPTPKTFTCTYSTTTNKFTMTLTQGIPVFPATAAADLQLYLTPYLAGILGMTQQTLPPSYLIPVFTPFTPQGTVTLAPITVTSNYTASVTGPNILYVNSVQLGNICKAYLPQSTLVTGETNPQMAMVPVNVNPGGIIWWQDPAPQEVFDTKNLFSLTRLDLYITAGTDPRPLQFNGLGFQIKLQLFVRYGEQAVPQTGTVGQGRAVLQIRPS